MNDYEQTQTRKFVLQRGRIGRNTQAKTPLPQEKSEESRPEVAPTGRTKMAITAATNMDKAKVRRGDVSVMAHTSMSSATTAKRLIRVKNLETFASEYASATITGTALHRIDAPLTE